MNTLPVFLFLILLEVSIAGAQTAAKTNEQDAERFRAAVAQIEASDDTKSLLAAMKVLRTGFPASRPFLVDAAENGSAKVKCFAIQALGDKGDARTDLEVVAKGLSDPKSKVRLAAVMAIRLLGKDGYSSLAEYLPGEVEPNNRKMAIKTIQQWNLRESVPLLVKILSTEKEKTVRNFLVTALESVTRKKLGDDLAAWQSYASDQALQDQAILLNTTSNSKKGGEKP